jgi:IS30 family transposase
MRSIARRLGRSPSTLSHEVTRQGAGVYSATEAGKDYRLRQLCSVRHRRLIDGSERSQFVRDHLVLYRWSPSRLLPSFAACTRTTPASA